MANAGFNSSQGGRAGQPYSYAVLTQNFGVFRVHGGYALQAGNNNSALLGADKTVKIANHDVMFRADAIQIDRRKDWAASFGGITPIGRHFALEAWVTQPTGGHNAGFTLKLNYILHL